MEEALSDHFGTKVTLVLQIDDSLAPPAAASAARPRRHAGRRRRAAATDDPPADDVEDVDPSELRGRSTDQASAAEARLLQAFPGASEVAE